MNETLENIINCSDTDKGIDVSFLLSLLMENTNDIPLLTNYSTSWTLTMTLHHSWYFHNLSTSKYLIIYKYQNLYSKYDHEENKYKDTVHKKFWRKVSSNLNVFKNTSMTSHGVYVTVSKMEYNYKLNDTI